MSTEYSAVTVVGYIESFKTVLKPFLKERAEVSHLEPRYDSRTGKELPLPATVIDTPAGYDLVIGGVVFEGPEDPTMEDDVGGVVTDDEVYEALSALLECCVTVRGGEYSQWWVCITPGGLPPSGGCIKIGDIHLAHEEVNNIRARAEKFGILLGDGGVWNVVEDY